MSTTKRWALVVVLLLAATTFLLAQWLDQDRDRQLQLPSARSEYTLEKFDLLVMNEQGSPRFQVQSPFLEKNPSDDSIDVRKPDLVLFDQGEPRWKITSEEGWISADGKKITLNGDVELIEQLEPSVTIRTRNLTINPDSYVASSESQVTVTRPGMTLAGTGFFVNLKERRYEILANVEASYEPF